ncbi:hypothetical protein PP7435_CHR2-0853 [Komagataella phaffii CBS 7435]|uniref:Prokaryotic-type class I peptide chain release factors domain-containing protein n=2 Tax=Komagataella phaffii TaxID=460519 RepID=C4R0P6_KOMPG|nr:Hypothetical protein PAS_chr2-1_0443 [Komagataella phaffii GS115]AOA62145.1 GQ67_00488T0 [Komagataella phaffii]CAH2448411.1 hypothetical protein BQ9382_C2-4590 [Komagataella phaffii CBS 7435]AOA67647.1 GQ68_00901T0 [Komagataella phaffii GS115]CAY69070.1 Hypothetical protein PAS_chr2-1_0443 [Komagataella phaffii GS115]SCV12074.1 hypothetical protein PP7435_CHR2-0853 [Komagataella phaffii CBS 7435]
MLRLIRLSSSLPKVNIPKANKMPARPTIAEGDIKEKFIKGGSGKGGQKINKTNSKVQLTHIATGIVVTSQATRSREQNRKIAREILALKLQDLEDPANSRQRIVIERQKMVKARKNKRTKAKYETLEKNKQEKEDLLEGIDEIVFIDENSEPIQIDTKQSKQKLLKQL